MSDSVCEKRTEELNTEAQANYLNKSQLLIDYMQHQLNELKRNLSLAKINEDALNKRIAELEEKQHWIPVEERLPEESDWTLIRYKGYRVPYTLYYDIDRGWACGETPDYWMSLPEMQEVNNE